MKNDDFEKMSDEELASMLVDNDDVFLHLMKRYEGRLLSYIIRLSGRTYEEAEDILQEVFLKVYKNINSFDPSLKFSSWIYRITHNEVISNYRKNKRHVQIGDAEAKEDILNKLTDDFSVKEKIDQDYLRKNVNSLLNKLDDKYKEVIVLKYFEEKEYSEISDILKKPVGTIATLLFRAKKELLKQIEKDNIELK